MITYQKESYDEVIEDIKPLLQDHYEEIALYKDKIALEPDFGTYSSLDSDGTLDIFTARDDGKLIGYVITVLYLHMHYHDHLYAVNDILYVDPDYRHTEVAPELIVKLEERMEELGVSVMTFHMKTYKPFETLMDSLGFDQVEYMYSKYIGK